MACRSRQAILFRRKRTVTANRLRGEVTVGRLASASAWQTTISSSLKIADRSTMPACVAGLLAPNQHRKLRQFAATMAVCAAAEHRASSSPR